MVVPKGAIGKYARKWLFPRAGMMKSGWLLPSAAKLANKVPAWITKARDNTKGWSAFTDAMDADASGFLKLENTVPYAARQGGLLRIELQKRERDLKKYAKLRLEGEAAKFNARPA